MLTEIPEGFIKMELVLTFEQKHIKVWEEKILYFLVRDFYIFYSKTNKFAPKYKFVELNFYCRPQDESSITYRIGCYSEAALRHYKPDYFANPIHQVPNNFPDCILLMQEKTTNKTQALAP